MNNAISMSADFERQKNIQASALTAAFAGAVLLMILMVKWSIPVKTDRPQEEYVEINLGNSDQGSGTDQPQLPGEPAPAQQVAYTPPQPAPSHEESVKDVTTEETEHDAPAVVKPAVSKPEATKINSESKVVKTNNATPQPVAPAPPKPRAVMGRTVGGNGNGGNGADTYKPGSNEGIAGGVGDQGRVGGSPDGTRYTGTPRNLGLRTVNIPSRSFEDDFKESGTVALDIVVDENGKLSSASYQPAGSSITNRSQIEIAKRRAAELSYPKYAGGFKQRITMNFQVRS
ncbi:MAG TPA: hypothetical protein VNR87_09325 [Flavisolibacter sp.]|nr:hypothetical protein [Flavisolibacter sp.]